MADFHIKKGDLEPPLELLLKYNNGDPIILTGATLKFNFKKSDGTAVSVAATIVNELTGAVKYSWSVGDTDTAGRMLGEFEAMYPSNRPLSVPNDKHLNIYVHEDLG